MANIKTNYMLYKSLNLQSPDVHFRKALTDGLASDKGLYFPKNIERLPISFFEQIETLDDDYICFKAIEQFIGDEIPEEVLRQIVSETINFEFPVVQISPSIFSLELFHGPTLAFKDVGARFMSRCLAYFNRENLTKKNTILVATSGDTGGAVANGFLGVSGVDVVILYPQNKVSDIQERQLTTLGQNIKAVEIVGTFDDCQDMVKKAFLDKELQNLNLTSANSINVARWLPQMFYYFLTYKKLKKENKPLVFSVPSGNFGNSCAGIVAKKLGLPIHHMIAATNSNDTIPKYLNNGNFDVKSTIPTLSNAMDVSNPSNFVRIQALYDNDIHQLKAEFSSCSYNDEETVEGMRELYKQFNYISEPHGAIGYLGLKNYLNSDLSSIGVFLATAHPVKFLETVERSLNLELEIPLSIESILTHKKEKYTVKTYEELKKFLNS